MLRILTKLLVLLFLISLLLAIYAPSILSTQIGKYALFRILKSITGYEIQAKEFKLQWLKGQKAEKVTVIDRKGRSIFQADSVITSAPLWKIAFYHDVGQLHIQSPFMLIDPPRVLAKKLAFNQAGFLPSLSFAFSPYLLGEIKVTKGAVQLISPGLEPISAKNIDLDAILLPQQIKVAAHGMTQEASDQGTFQVRLFAYPGSDQIDAAAQIVRFPLRAADQIVSIIYPKLRGILQETIGESLDAELRLKNLQNNLEIYLNASSNYFSAHLETKLQQDHLILASPALFQIQIPGKSFQQLTQLPLKNVWKSQIKIDELSIPLQNQHQFVIQGTLKSEAMEFEEATVDPFSLYIGNTGRTENSPNTSSSEDWSIKIDSSQLQFSGSVHLSKTWEQLSFTGEALLPKNTKVDITAESLSSISMIVQGDLGHGRFKGAIDPYQKTIALVEPGFLTLELINLPSPLSSLLTEPLPIQISVEPCLINFQTRTGWIRGKAEVTPFELGAAHLDSTDVQFTGNMATGQIQFSFMSKVDNGPLNIEGMLTWPETWKEARPSHINLKGSCQNFPIASLQPFLKDRFSLLPLLGETLTTHLEASMANALSSLKIQADSPNLSIQAQLRIDQKQLQLIEPANFNWKLTPDGHQTLVRFFQGSSAVTLSSPVSFKGSVDVLILPLQNNLSIDQILNSLQYQGQISADQFSLTHNQQISQVSQLLIQLNHPATSDSHQFQLSAAASSQGTLSCCGDWTPAGSADIHLLVDHFPSAVVDFFVVPFRNNRFSLTTLCGPLLNLTLDTTLNQWSGPLKLDLHSDHLRSSLHGALNQGVLTLSDTFHLQLDLTSASSRILFNKVNPLALSSMRSEGPITLEVAPQGFSYPLFPFQTSKIQLGQGCLELGKLFCRNEGNLQVILGLLKLGQYRVGDELNLWFSPLDFHIKNGVLNCERTELLIADHFQVCLWGNINFPNNSVDAILGLTPSCLQNAFGIKNLPENYVLQIPLHGMLTNVKINKNAATTKIGALLIWQQKATAAGKAKGPAGAILGEMLNKIGPLPGGDQTAPPAKRPFPWETPEYKKPSAKKKASKTKDRKHFHPQDSALKQALKIFR